MTKISFAGGCAAYAVATVIAAVVSGSVIDTAYAQSEAKKPGAKQSGVAPYIRAKPQAMLKIYGPEVTKRVFSNALTAIRRQKIRSTVGPKQGVNCSKKMKVALYAIIPYRLKQGSTVWIERYAIRCDKVVGRNLLMVLNDKKVQALELVRGATRTDPLLQRDLKRGLGGAVRAKAPKDCKSIRLIDTKVTDKGKKRGFWAERWEFNACGKAINLAISFKPSAKGGTSWSGKIVE